MLKASSNKKKLNQTLIIRLSPNGSKILPTFLYLLQRKVLVLKAVGNLN